MDGVLLLEHVRSIYARFFLCLIGFRRLSIALELAKHNPVYEDIASKFFEVSGDEVHDREVIHIAIAFHFHCRRHDVRGR